VSKNRFKNVIAKFAPEFENLKLLACKLQFALFLIRDGDIFTSTFHDYSIMYNSIIKAFNKVITSLKKEEQANA